MATIPLPWIGGGLQFEFDGFVEQTLSIWDYIKVQRAYHVTSECQRVRVLKSITLDDGGTIMATSVKLDDDLKSKVQHLASLRNRSPHWIMREAIRDYIEREEAKERFKEEALASWNSYKETGRHLTGQEVRDWLQTWGTDNESEIPGCHD